MTVISGRVIAWGARPPPGAVFRALAENPGAPKTTKHGYGSNAPKAGCKGSPTTSGTGLL